MEDNNQNTAIKNLFTTAQSVIIALPPDPGKDLVVAGIALNQALKDSGKSSQIGCGSDIHVNEEIEGITNISDTIGSRNLIISFDYKEEDLDKVDYDVRDDGKFYLLIKPKTGSPVPDIGGVKYSYSGASSDIVITLGVGSLEELGKIYADEKNFLDNASIISLNTSLKPSSFTSNLYHKNATSFSELVSGLLESLDLKVSLSTAGNLLAGIYENTNNLNGSNATADTFSSIAYLMRLGAHFSQPQTGSPSLSKAPFFEVVPEPIPFESSTEENIPLPEEENAPVPSDWSKPKIFRVGDNKKQ